MGDLGIDVDAPDGGPDSIEVEGDAYVFALSQTVETIESGQPVRERIALLIPIDELSIRRIPRLVMAVCITVLFFLTAACWVMSCMRLFRREAITVQERKQYGVERARRSLIAFGLAGVLTIGLGTFFVNCLMQLYTATQNNMNLLERISVIASETQESAQRAQRTREEIYVNYARRIADLLSEYPQLKTRETLAEMCNAVDADYLMIYDDHGREALSNAPYVNLSFSRDRESTDHEFRLLLSGVPSVVHEACVDEKTLLERQLVGVRMDDGDVSDGYGALIMAIRLLTGVLCSLLQKRGETVCRLISSFLQYVAVLALVFAAFDCLGFDTRALLASVGILSLAVSLGAKDLAADVLSGISIAFSDEYQIGDYIQISDFRGWMQDIGVRSTTLVNNDGNIKHFSNRDVKNILNLSRRNCQYTITVTIASDQPLRKIEEILDRELPRIGKATPEIISGPEYKGVKGFTAGA